ncbi:MAG: ABC transporter substrate-binding protein [Rhodospirillales bacterium]|nr:ABC transporter substrate-binding protein [Rhodospirillales bacterium]
MAAGLAFAAAGQAAAADRPQCGLDTGKPATGAPIEIGAVVGKTGPADFSASARAAKAYFECVNANGGINGRRIHYTIADDAWNPEQAAQVATKLVNDTKVVAMVGNSSMVDCSVNEKLYEAENLVVIAGVGVPRDCFFSKNIAPTNAGPRLSNIGGAVYLDKTFGLKKVVCVSANIPGVGDWSCGGVADWGKTHGVEVKVILTDPGSLDPTSLILQIAAFNPDAIDINLPKEPSVPVFAAAQAQGMGGKYKWFSPASSYDASFPKAVGPYWDNRIYVQLELEPLDKKAPDNLNWMAVLKKYGNVADASTFSQAGYLAARIATQAMLKLDPAKIDRASVGKALRDVKGFKSDIICGAWYFGPGSQHNAIHAGSEAVVHDGGFETKASCFAIDDPELAPVLKVEKELHLSE